MKILKRICLFILLLASIIPSVSYASEIYTFTDRPPQLEQRSLATVFYISEYDSRFENQTIFLKSNDIIIKVATPNRIDLNIGDTIQGEFNKTSVQPFYNSRTHEYFDGEVLCKRIPVSPTDDKNNTYIKGENNTYENNTVIKGENNINRNNVYIAGDNNTITGNTHYQGSNNVYEDNIIIGSSDNTINNTTTYGESNRTIKGQIINKGNDKSTNPSRNNTWRNTSKKTASYFDCFLLFAFLCIPIGFSMYDSYLGNKQKFIEDCKFFMLVVVAFLQFF